MKHCLRSISILSFCFVLTQITTAQTNVSGLISANTNWSLNGSPYIVTSNILLDQGFTLTIDPGVVIKFNTGTTLEIKGTLTAIGTAANYITFTSNQAIPQPGDWSGIQFVTQATDYNSSNQTGCIMKYCIVEYADYTNGAIFIQDAEPLIAYNIMRNNKGFAIESEANTDYAVVMTIDHNYFINNGASITNDSHYIRVTYNLFYNSKAIYLGQPDAVVAHNIVVGPAQNYYDFGYQELIQCYFYYLPCSFQYNTVVDNWLDAESKPSNSYFISAEDQSTTDEFSYNTIVRNRIFNIDPGYTYYMMLYHLDYTTDQLIFNHNNFYDNSGDPDLAGHLFYYYSDYTYPNAIAEENYWHTTSNSVIDSLVIDWFDNGTSGIVDYQPTLSTPDIVAPVTPPENVIKTDIGGGNIQLSWNPNLEGDLAGYKIYWGGYSGYSFTNSVDVGNVTSYTLSGINMGDTIGITAYDNQMNNFEDQFDGNESWFTYATDTTLTEISELPFANGNFAAVFYPNPFSSATTLSLQCNHAVPSLTLIIYNQLGQKVETLSGLQLGESSLTFDLPAAVYFYRIGSKGVSFASGTFAVD